jgi:UPF0271 protein
MERKIDLNCDLGESFGAYTIGNDLQVLAAVSSANIACGYHAGDHNVMAKTVRAAKEKKVKIGAHPGFHDLIGFGRRNIDVTPEDVYNSIVYQISALKGFCEINDTQMHHVKPHGALYNVAARNKDIAIAIASAVKDVDFSLILYGLANSELISTGEKLRLKTASEVFADRTYQDDGTLTPRSEENAVIRDLDVVEKQLINMIKEGKVQSISGKLVPIKADTVCVHGDNPQALIFLDKLREKLRNEGIIITSVGD